MMTWVLVGLLGGSLLTSEHQTREACEGRAVILREKGAQAKCVELGSSSSNLTYQIYPSTMAPLR